MHVDFALPKLDLKLIETLREADQDDDAEESEELMREWIELFLEEIDKIDTFFKKKLDEYGSEYKLLKDTFNKKKNGIQIISEGDQSHTKGSSCREI